MNILSRMNQARDPEAEGVAMAVEMITSAEDYSWSAGHPSHASVGKHYSNDCQRSRTICSTLDGGSMQEYVEEIAMCIARGKVSKSSWYPPDMKDQDGADEIAADALENGLQPSTLLEGCMLGMDRIGKEFSENKAAVTNLVISAAAMNAVLKHIKPFLESGEVKRKGKFVIGTCPEICTTSARTSSP